MNDQISGDNHGEGRKASTLSRFIPGGRFWGFYSASPISIKVAVVLCGMFLARPVSDTFSPLAVNPKNSAPENAG